MGHDFVLDHHRVTTSSSLQESLFLLPAQTRNWLVRLHRPKLAQLQFFLRYYDLPGGHWLKTSSDDSGPGHRSWGHHRGFREGVVDDLGVPGRYSCDRTFRLHLHEVTSEQSKGNPIDLLQSRRPGLASLLLNKDSQTVEWRVVRA